MTAQQNFPGTFRKCKPIGPTQEPGCGNGNPCLPECQTLPYSLWPPEVPFSWLVALFSSFSSSPLFLPSNQLRICCSKGPPFRLTHTWSRACHWLLYPASQLTEYRFAMLALHMTQIGAISGTEGKATLFSKWCIYLLVD